MRILVVAAMTILLVNRTPAEVALKAPTPLKEHEWLRQLEGVWETDAEAILEPGKPPVKCKGTETVRSLGGFWMVGEMKNEMMGVTMTGVMTIGYDPQKKKYVGTWVCSMCDLMFKYEGTVEGKVLTLETERPNPLTGKIVKMRDSNELKDKDHKVMTSTILGEDGKWTPFMTLHARRKK